MSTNAPTPDKISGTADVSLHREPPAQGGETYVRCEDCGAELLTKLGGADNLHHREGCSVRC